MDAIDIIQDILCLTLFGTEIVEMADDLSQLLFSFANYSNFYAVVTILFCFVITAVLILRFNNDLLHFPVLGPLPPNTAVKRSMMGYTNPFSVQLKEPSSTTLKNGFTLSVSSLAEGHMAVFWGPSIDTVHEILQWSAPTVLDSLTTGQLLSGNDDCLSSKFDIRLEKDESRDIHIDCPECIDERTLGYTPRQRYPCVVVTAVLYSGHSSDELPAVIANFTMLHLRDSIVTLESQIVGQFLKLRDNRVYNLQPVFLATDNDSSSRTVTSEKDSTTKNCDSTEADIPEKGATCATTNNISSVSSGEQCLCEENCDCLKTSSRDNEYDDRELCNTVGSVSVEDKNSVTSGMTEGSMSDSSRCHTCESWNSQPGQATITRPEVSQNSSNRFENTSFPTDTDMISEIADSTSSAVQSSASLRSSESVSSEQQTSNLPWNDPTSVADTDGPLEADGPECVVCQMNAISHVILPCRHACVCGLCFKKMDRCPMCRGYIDTYFTLFDDGDSDPDATDSDQADSEETGFVAWVASLNERLNEYLGLT